MIKIYLLRWFISFGYLIDGVVGIISFGFIKPFCALRLAKIYSKYRYLL